MKNGIRQNRDYSYYRKSDYAKYFDVSRPTVDKKIRDGDLETVEIGGVTFIKVKIDKVFK